MKRELITNIGLEENIDYIGVIKPEEYKELETILEKRKANDYNTEFENEDFDTRINPMLTMENVKSIIVIGINYWTGSLDESGMTNTRGYVSRSSWGEDYHKILNGKLEAVVDKLNKLSPSNMHKCYVDTGPLVDRHLAYRASMGFYGMNNSIINEKLGSWLYIGYILTDLKIDIEEVKEVPNGCGECDKCIRACPTNALLGKYEYDATKCISYLTQTKKYIPYELREKMGNSIYGCDICQLVCPYNDGIKANDEEALKPNIELVFPHLKQIIYMTKKEFNEKYSLMALSWRGKNVIVRNALIAMGNRMDEACIGDLKVFLKSPSQMLREYSAWALARIGTVPCLEILEEFKSDKDLNEEIEKLLEYYYK